MVADPMFMGYIRKDFRLRPGSPTLKMGIVSLDSVGLLGPVGAKVPVKELNQPTGGERPFITHNGDLLVIDGLGQEIESVEVCEVTGKVVKQFTGVNKQTLNLYKNEIPLKEGVLRVKTTHSQSVSPVFLFR